jgi:hypothetical protein
VQTEVNVLLTQNLDVRRGDRVLLVGAPAELGAWDRGSAVALRPHRGKEWRADVMLPQELLLRGFEAKVGGCVGLGWSLCVRVCVGSCGRKRLVPIHGVLFGWCGGWCRGPVPGLQCFDLVRLS